MTHPDCLFCRIVSGEVPAKELYRDDEVVAFRDIAPQAPTHILIIPTRHISGVPELSDGDATLMGGLILRAGELAREEGIEDSGYRLVINSGAHAGQAVDHIHLHLLGGGPLGALA